LIEIDDNLRIPESEIAYTFSPSSKPGGQNVNKVSTRVTLVFDVEASRGLSDDQRRRIAERLGSRLTKDGLLRVVSQKYRSQGANREAARARFVELLRGALARRPVRKKAGVPREVKERRLRAKKRRSQLKSERSMIDYDGD
jgi:ribosome-associated protein